MVSYKEFKIFNFSRSEMISSSKKEEHKKTYKKLNLKLDFEKFVFVYSKRL